MSKSKVAVTLESQLLARLDRMVRGGQFPNRSQAIEVAVSEKLERLERRRLAAECALLDRQEEQGLAEEGLGADATAWPAY